MSQYARNNPDEIPKHDWLKGGIRKSLVEKHPATLCCNYSCPTTLPYPVMWNEFNKVVQCHNCGQQWIPKV